MPVDQTITARELWGQLGAMSQADRWGFLEAHKLLVDGEWRSFEDASVERSLSTPLLLHTESLDQHRVPMDAVISVRPAG